MIRIININDNEYKFKCEYGTNSKGFTHTVMLYVNGKLTDRCRNQYYNRTWEKYDYQSVMIDVMNFYRDKVMNKEIEKFKTEKGYKRMNEKRNWELSIYLGHNIEYREKINEIDKVIKELEDKSY